MSDLPPVLATGIVFYFVYKVFELFVRKNERIAIIEKLGQKISETDTSVISAQLSSLLGSFPKRSFTGLRTGCLLLGVGLGFLVGLFICYYLNSSNVYQDKWELHNLYGIAYVASACFFGGAGLIVSYVLEKKRD
ncbi:MAG: hypothetical protein LBD53_06355 [Tannerella sp.]|nr:hypothetical protein [Tannerella sp.]